MPSILDTNFFKVQLLRRNALKCAGLDCSEKKTKTLDLYSLNNITTKIFDSLESMIQNKKQGWSIENN